MRIATNLYKSENGARLVEDEYERLLGEWPIAARRFEVATRLGSTFVIACGDESAPPLVLLHGGGVNSSMWLEYARQFEPHFRVFAADLPGEPGFSAPSRPPFTNGEYASWLDDVLNSLTIVRPSIVGASLGGWLALDYAARRADRVERLVLLGPMGVGRVRASFLLTTMPLLLLGNWGRLEATRRIIGPFPSAASFPDRGLLRLIQTHFRARMTPIPILTNEALASILSPVLAIVGDKDVIADSHETKQRLERNCSSARILMLPAAGHRIFAQGDSVVAYLKQTDI